MLFDIFKTFFKIGAFTIGGGYAMIPVIQKEIVENKKWLKDDEFLDSIAVTNSLPGPLAINCATFVGYKTSGFWGALSALLGAVMPSFIIILLIAAFFNSIKSFKVVEYIFAGVRPAVVALIIFALLKLTKSMKTTAVNIALAIVVLLMILIFNIHPIITILTSGTIGFFLLRKEEEKQ